MNIILRMSLNSDFEDEPEVHESNGREVRGSKRIPCSHRVFRIVGLGASAKRGNVLINKFPILYGNSPPAKGGD